MPKDYKHRVHSKPRRREASHKSQGVTWWRWLLVFLVLFVFGAFLWFLRDTGSDKQQSTAMVAKKPVKTVKAKAPAKAKPKPKPKPKPDEPRFDFYTILPKKEVVIPDYEQKTRAREESVGKAKSSKYILQAGSFREFSEADKQRARLALMGIESRVEKAKVGSVTWHRVKMGPYSRMSSVNTLKSRLRQSGIDVMVMELGG